MNSLMVRQNQTVVVGTSSKGIYCIDRAAHITRHIDVGLLIRLRKTETEHLDSYQKSGTYPVGGKWGAYSLQI